MKICHCVRFEKNIRQMRFFLEAKLWHRIAGMQAVLQGSLFIWCITSEGVYTTKPKKKKSPSFRRHLSPLPSVGNGGLGASLVL